MKKEILTFFIFLFLLASCIQPKVNKDAAQNEDKSTIVVKDTHVIKEVQEIRIPALEDLKDTMFVRLKDYSDDFVYDMKYATTDNFLKAKVYDCPECYVRVATAKALIAANTDFSKLGYRIKFFDCYRPHDVQKKMWKILPNTIYVADPAKGSIHNKGGAVDITLVNERGEELDMGTPFDYFGKEAHQAYEGFDDSVLENRRVLRETMEKNGFLTISSEWWHYNLEAMLNAKVANFKWNCPTSD